MKHIHVLVFLLLLAWSAGAVNIRAQQSQETVNAVNNERQNSQEAINAVDATRIARLEDDAAKIRAAISDMVATEAALRSSLDKLTGIGIGVGFALTALQALLVILTYRNGQNRRS